MFDGKDIFMRILVISDTHGKLDRFWEVFNKLRIEDPVQMIVHCGDYLQDAKDIRMRAGIPVISVGGNCDGNFDDDGYSILETEAGDFMVTHGHMQNVNFNLQKLYYRAQEAGCIGALFGHTHRSCYVDHDGIYAFERLREDVYSVRYTLGSAMLFTDFTGREGDSSVPVVDGNVGATNAFALAMGEKKDDLNVGGILPGRIGDTVWHDQNGNGLQDYKEPLLPGVQLTLLVVNADGTMTEIATTQSDQYGYFAFDALRPSTYVLRLDAREGDTLTSCFGAPLGEIDSDLDPDTGMSAPIALRSGQTLLNIDVGLTDYAR